MSEMQLAVNSYEPWRFYRSTLLGRPIKIKQAYNSVYPWIEYDGVYFNRFYEMCVYFMYMGLAIPESLRDGSDIIRSAYYSIKNGAKVFSEIAIAKPENNSFREHTLKTYPAFTLCGEVGINAKNCKSTVYTDVYSLGGDYCISREQCLRNSYKMPVVIRPETLLEADTSMVYWPNVWVWED